jgi:Domain of unknown function (DUF4390)
MPRIIPAGCLLLLLFPPGPLTAVPGEEPAASDAGPARIAALEVARSDGTYLASFRLESVFDPEILGNIESGLETVFDYRLEVIRHRRFWIDERTIQHRILVSTRYDSLSRQYGLLLKIDGEVERSSTTDKPEEMRRWMTEIQGIPLGPVSGFVPADEYAVRVKSSLQPRFILLFIPWDRDTAWMRVPLLDGRPDVPGPGN